MGRVSQLIRRLMLAICVSVAPSVAISQASDTPLEKLESWAQSHGWEGVGLLVVGNQSSCTGALLRPDLVLTAAHCLVGSDDAPVEPSKVVFRAGWRNGEAIARRLGERMLVHEGYLKMSYGSGQRAHYDIALLQLNAPIMETHALAFESGRSIGTGAEVSVVSYGLGRNDAPSQQKSCMVLETAGNVYAMSCDVVPGSSGAPVFAMQSGTPRIVALVSAIGAMDGMPISLAVDVDSQLNMMLKDFEAGRGVYPAVNAARRVGVENKRAISGARFVRP